jgi:tRNA (mo5U34)-methyltransferase
MRSRQWGRGEWSIALSIPDRAAAPLRAAVRLRRHLGTPRGGRDATREMAWAGPPAGTLELGEAPRIALVKHDPQATVDSFVVEARRSGRAAIGTVAEEIQAEDWYHTIELPDGTVTLGRFDHRPLVPHYGLPDDMSGMTALDIGTADGFWAFEMERRGADVVALELPRLSDRDFPFAAKELVRAQADTPPGRRFELARQALGSRAELVRLVVYDIDPSRLGKFDFVHVGDILWALRDPPLALAAIRSVTAGAAHIADRAEPRVGAGAGELRNLAAYHGGWNRSIWWTPSVQTLAQMTLDAGFAEVEALRMYRLAFRGRTRGPWRVILRAHP